MNEFQGCAISEPAYKQAILSLSEGRIQGVMSLVHTVCTIRNCPNCIPCADCLFNVRNRRKLTKWMLWQKRRIYYERVPRV